jgi:UDP-N-acetyl-2-amino-2-deoxyglucuronate dehydrogenase
MKKIRFAIVGCGVIHGTHIDAIRHLSDDAELVAVCDEVPGRAQRSGEKLDLPYYENLEQMLKEADFDVLNVCTPSGLHAKHGVLGATYGKHVVCEKPIDVTLPAADALIETCDKNGVKLVVVSQHRYSSGMRQLKQYLDEGRLGNLVYAESVTKWYRTQEYYDSGGWRGTWALDGGGALMNQGVHYVDQMRWIMGPVKSVSATMATRAHERIEVEDIVTANIEFQSGAVGTLLASTAMYPGYRQALEIYGTGGTVIIENSKVRHAQFQSGNEERSTGGVKAAPPEIKDFVAATPSAVAEGANVSVQGASNPASIALDGHVEHLKDLIGAIRENRPTFMNGSEARNALELIVAVYRSAQTGKRVDFPVL